MEDRYAPPSFGRRVAKPDGVTFSGPADDYAPLHSLTRYVTDGNGPVGQIRPSRAAVGYQVGACQFSVPVAVVPVLRHCVAVNPSPRTY